MRQEEDMPRAKIKIGRNSFKKSLYFLQQFIFFFSGNHSALSKNNNFNENYVFVEKLKTRGVHPEGVESIFSNYVYT